MNAVSTPSTLAPVQDQRIDSHGASSHRATLFAFVVLLFLAVLVEIACAALIYATRGDILSGVVVFAACLNLGAVVLYAFRRRLAAVAFVGVLALGIVAFAARDGHRLLRVQEEAAGVVTYVYETRLRTGALPADLRGYARQSPDLVEHVHYTSQSDTGFMVVYGVPGSNSNYWYSSSDGWHYYPD